MTLELEVIDGEWRSKVKSKYLSICLSVCLSVCLSIYLFTSEYSYLQVEYKNVWISVLIFLVIFRKCKYTDQMKQYFNICFIIFMYNFFRIVLLFFEESSSHNS